MTNIIFTRNFIILGEMIINFEESVNDESVIEKMKDLYSKLNDYEKQLIKKLWETTLTLSFLL